MSLRHFFREHRNSFAELNNEHEEECNTLQDKIDELELELEFEKSRRIDAVSYALSLKQRRQKRDEETSDQQERSNAQKKIAARIEEEADRVEEKIMEKYETEKALRQELKAKDEMIKDLRHTVDDQDKLISHLRKHLAEASASPKADSNENEKSPKRRTSLDELMARLQSLPTASDMLEETAYYADVKDAKESGTGALKKDPDDCTYLYSPRRSSTFSLREE